MQHESASEYLDRHIVTSICSARETRLDQLYLRETKTIMIHLFLNMSQLRGK